MIRRILFQGDSITDAGRTALLQNPNYQLGTGYPLLVNARLRADEPARKYDIIDRGVSGNRVVDLYARWKIDALNLNPDLISILIGVNDTWHEQARKNGVDVPRYEQIYRMILAWSLEELPALKLVLLEPFVLESALVNIRWIYEVRERAAVVKKLAEEFGAVFVPLQERLSEAAAKAGDNLAVLRDGVHPTPLGHQVIADAWIKAVKPML